MKKVFISLTVMLCVFPAVLFGEDSLDFINALGNKKQAVFQDAVAFFAVELGKEDAGFRNNLDVLKAAKILSDENYNAMSPLRRGTVALFAARYLKLGDSLFYLAFGTERYAHRACIASELMDADSSEWDSLSGEELIEIMSRISAKAEGR